MAVSFIGAGSVSTTVGSATPTVHASTADGDLVLLLLEHPNNITIANVCNGFEEICSLSNGASGTGEGLWVGWTKYVAAEWAAPPNPSAGDHLSASLLTFRGAEVDERCYDVIATNVAASSTSVTFPSVTTTVANTMVVNILSSGFDTSVAQASAWANAGLSGYAEILDFFSVNGNGGGLAAACGTLASAGSSGASTATLANASVQCQLTIALREAGSYGGFPASPTVASVTTGFDVSSVTTRNVTLPATVNSGDVLVAAFASDGSPTVTWDNSTAGTWTQRADLNSSPTGTHFSVYTKTADGTEDGLNLSIGTSTAEQAAWSVFRITGASGNVELTTPATGTASRSPSPRATLTPSWGAADTLWLGLTGRDDGTTLPQIRPPMWTSGSNLGDTDSGCGAIEHGYLTYNATSFAWPGILVDNTEVWTSLLMAFEPSGGAPADTLFAQAVF